MKIFDPHAHMYSRTTGDYEAMALAGIEAVVEPAFWWGQPRRHLGTYLDYFEYMLGFETARAGQFGIRHYVCLAQNPREANDETLTREVLAALPDFLDRPGVVAVGEVGFDDQTLAEEKALRAQLELAREHDLPVLIHLPHRRKREGTEYTVRVLRDMEYDPDKVILDHNTEETIDLSREFGSWCGHTVYPKTKLSPERAANIFGEHGFDRMLVNCACDWGPSDPLRVPRTILELRSRDVPRETIQKLVWDNPVAFFGQSGRLGDITTGSPDRVWPPNDNPNVDERLRPWRSI